MTSNHSQVLHKIQSYLQSVDHNNNSTNGADEKLQEQNKNTVSTQTCILSEEERSQFRNIMNGCPAFHGGSNAQEQHNSSDITCPFKNVETPQKLKEQLLNIPQSHKKCPAFVDKKQELKANREDRKLIENLFVFRWDLFFDEPLKDFGLCRELRRRTTKKHIEAESVPFIKRFVKLDICPFQYRIYLANLYKVYETLEPALDQASPNHKLLQKIYFPQELKRLEALERDLLYFYGPNWRELMTVVPATKPYTDRIRQIVSDPSKHHLLIAHASTRYLGDLYGGQQLQKKSRAALKLPEGKGTCFYEFDHAKRHPRYNGSVIQFRNYLEKQMNKLPVTAQECEEIITEANLVFELNMHMFEELDTCQDLIVKDKQIPFVPRQYDSRMWLLLISILLTVAGIISHYTFA